MRLLGLRHRQVLEEEGLLDQLCDIPDIESLHKIVAMDFDGLGADVQLLADLPTRIAVRNESEHLELAGRERGRLLGHVFPEDGLHGTPLTLSGIAAPLLLVFVCSLRYPNCGYIMITLGPRGFYAHHQIYFGSEKQDC